jgi:hypothetical protein
MGMKGWTRQRVFRVAGSASIGAALLAVAGDEVSQYSPQGYASLADIERALPFWRLLTGEMLGVLGIPLCLIGYWCICQALRRSGVKGARIMFWLIAYGLVMGVVSHALISSAYIVMQAGNASAMTGATNNLRMAVYLPGGIFLVSYLITSAWYMVAVISGRTLYPRWMAFFNPFLLSLLLALLNAAHVLSFVVNMLWPAWLSIPHLILFTLSTLVLWNSEKPFISHPGHLRQRDSAGVCSSAVLPP